MKTSQNRRKDAKRRLQNLSVCLRLIFCFPLGLYVMWTRTRWPRFVKVATTAFIAMVLTAILLPMTNPPSRGAGGIVLVGVRPEVEILGPEAPADRDVVEIYAPRRTAIIVEATPTPEPVIVYCNPGGLYYHNQGCKWVVATTPQATLTQALKAGYLPCTECDAPPAIG